MSNFVPHPLDDRPPPLEELSHPERPQDPETNFVINEILQVAVNTVGEEASHQEHLRGVQQVVITAIRATDLTLGLRRIPAGFHVVVKVDGIECQTSNKPVHVDQAVVEWNEQILLPCEPSSLVRVSVYASFELDPMLCHGEVLRTFNISVGELLDRSEKSRPIIFRAKQHEVVSSYTSLFMKAEQRCSNENADAVVCPHTTLTSGDMDVSVLETDTGHRLLAQYRRMKDNGDLDQSIKHFERALDFFPVEHPCRPAALFNLATAKFVSHQANGTYLDLDIPITLFEDALEFRPDGHADRPITQLHLAIALLFRFAKQGSETDADAAEELLSDVLDVCHSNSHIYRAALLAIDTFALHGAGGKGGRDLEQKQPTAFMLPLSPDQLARRVEWCSYRDDPRELDEVISLHYDALRYYGTMHDCREQLQCNLGVMLYIRYNRRGNNQDLDEAITRLREALDVSSVGRAHRSKSSNNLANMLYTRFQHRGNDQDLDDAIMLHRDALTLHPVGHPDRSSSLSNLGSVLYIRFQHRGNDQDLDDAIKLYRDALALRPVGHPDRSSSLNNLATVLCTCFRHRGNDQDLDDAIMLHRDALALHPIGHPDRSSSLTNFATTLTTCFKRRGNNQDLDEAILLHRESLALLPAGHSNRSKLLNNLASTLSTRFRRRSNDQDLDEAIMLHRDVLALCPVDHPDRPMSLYNLASMLSTRFRHRGNDQDLDDAIMLHRYALTLHPVGHPNRSSVSYELASTLLTRYQLRDNDQDSYEAIMLHRDVLALRPVGHPDRFKSLYNLGTALFTCFQHRGNDQDLDEAIMHLRGALALHPVGHPDRPSLLSNLASTLSTRFEHRGNAEDLHESREHLRCALTPLTQHDPHLLHVHQSLAAVYLLFPQSGLDGTGEDTDSQNAAMHHLKAAANVVSAGLLPRLQASLRWARDADQHSHDTALEAYANSMQLLDAFMSATASVSSRHSVLKKFSNTLAMDAASCALRCGDVCRAVELLEQGRTVIWTQMTQNRTPLDSLQDRGDHAVVLMKKFKELSSLLDTPPTNHPERTPGVDVDAEAIRSRPLDAEASRYRRVVEDWNRVVEKIRKIEGFSRFLLPPLFSYLQDAACDGPIVVLVASKSSCDAIIVPHKQPPISIQLTTDLDKLMILAATCQEIIQKDAGPKRAHPELVKILRTLWNDVVSPVVKQLDIFARPGSRIWWCPTGPFNFLPLHAAGEYKKHGRSISQLYISSYTPSLTALIRARSLGGHDRPLSVPFVAIGQNHPPGHKIPLAGVEPELDLVRDLLPPPPTVSFTKIMSVDATKSRASRALRDNTWIHFACHGTQNFDEPFDSAFLMRDQPLSLLDISQMDLSQHEFAFLSACETAVGDANTPDEVIHLAASLQLAGIKSVVGTLWEVNDDTVQHLVKAFYNKFCGDGIMDSKRAARALHRAVQSLASDKDLDMPLDQRIVFMHVGI